LKRPEQEANAALYEAGELPERETVGEPVRRSR
jgi:hypothetical protein